MLQKLTILLSVVCMTARTTAQDTAIKKPCQPKDLVDYVRQLFKIKPKATEKNSSFFIAPVFGSTPSTGFVYGITMQGAPTSL